MEKAREALQSEYEHIVEELRSHEEAMASLEEKIEEEGEKREEELNRCRKVIEELKQQLEDSEKSRVEQQQKVMVVNPGYSHCTPTAPCMCRMVMVVTCASLDLAACALVDLPEQALGWDGFPRDFGISCER